MSENSEKNINWEEVIRIVNNLEEDPFISQPMEMEMKGGVSEILAEITQLENGLLHEEVVSQGEEHVNEPQESEFYGVVDDLQVPLREHPYAIDYDSQAQAQENSVMAVQEGGNQVEDYRLLQQNPSLVTQDYYVPAQENFNMVVQNCQVTVQGNPTIMVQDNYVSVQRNQVMVAQRNHAPVQENPQFSITLPAALASDIEEWLRHPLLNGNRGNYPIENPNIDTLRGRVRQAKNTHNLHKILIQTFEQAILSQPGILDSNMDQIIRNVSVWFTQILDDENNNLDAQLAIDIANYKARPHQSMADQATTSSEGIQNKRRGPKRMADQASTSSEESQNKRRGPKRMRNN